jgi:heme/copper-type cytochrome/quinol oxidase subunit 2
VFLPGKQIWWEAPNAVRIPTGIIVALVLGLRIYSVYRSSKNTPKRSPKVKRVERIVAISLWSFIAAGVTLLLLLKH